MSYEKQTWVTGEVITADKLNHIEDGIKNINNQYNEGFFQGQLPPEMTANKLLNMLKKGIRPVLYTDTQILPLTALDNSDGFAYCQFGGNYVYQAKDPDRLGDDELIFDNE